ncbi:hypothetical protein ACDA55_35020 [Rhizobium ruizarguesonis]
MKALRNILSHGVTQGFATLAAFVFGALLVTFARDPIERFVIPKAMAVLGGGQVLQMYWPTPGQTVFTKADMTLSVYWPGSTDELSGRVIAQDGDGKDSPDSQSVLTGFRQNNVVSFTYRTVAEGRTGIGAFFGTYDQRAKVYVGTLTGYMHDEEADECSVDKAIAVLGDVSAKAKFLDLANASLRRNLAEAASAKPKLAEAPSGSESVKCPAKT